MTMPKFALFAALAAILACGGEPPRQRAGSAGDTASPAPDTVARIDTTPKASPPIAIATDLRSYRPGDPVQLRITNTTDARYTFNPCTRTIEQRADSADNWTVIKEERICTMIAHVLEPKSTRSERTELAETLSPGTYRLAIAFSPDQPAARTKGVTGYTVPITVTH